MTSPKDIRNLSIIAHVDHGKSTLSDTLIQAGGQLSKAKMGTCALDTDPLEQEKGITIKSTAITLDFEVAQDLVTQAHQRSQTVINALPPELRAPPKATEAQAEAGVEVEVEEEVPPEAHEFQVYIGNLPYSITEDLMRSTVAERLPNPNQAEAFTLVVRPKRGFSVVTFSTKEASDAFVKSVTARPLVLEEREAVVELKGESAVLQLKAHCRLHKLGRPAFERIDHGYGGEGSSKKQVELTIGDSGEHKYIGIGDTLVAAKQAAAENALAVLTGAGKRKREISPDANANASPSSPSDESMESEGGSGSVKINLIDCPGHIDFSSEVSAALRITDGAIVLVDCVEGVCVQTETVLKQALLERVRPVLFLNKMDRVIGELQMTPEEAFQGFTRTINAVNDIIGTYQDYSLPDQRVSWEDGTVAFGSGKQGWAFNVDTFIDVYARRGKGTKEELAKKLKSGKSRDKWFVKMFVQPIYDLYNACMQDTVTDPEAVTKRDQLLSKLEIVLTKEERELPSRKILQAVMQAFIPAWEVLVHMITVHLPSPTEAQLYRAHGMYAGDPDRHTAAIQACAAEDDTPLVFFVSKLIMTGASGGNHFVALGRVFSGVIKQGMHVRVLPEGHTPAMGKQGVREGKVQSLHVMMGAKSTSVYTAGPGAVVSIHGLDNVLDGPATLTSTGPAAATIYPLKTMRLAVSPVVKASLSVTSADKWVKLVTVSRNFAKGDNSIQVSIDEDTKELVVAAVGELQLQVFVHNVSTALGGTEVKASDPIVTFRETVTEEGRVCYAKSGNKHNRVWIRARPLEQAVVDDIDEGNFKGLDVQRVQKRLVEKHGWATQDARKVWAIGPDACGPNLLVDETFGVQMTNLKDSIVEAFQQVTAKGPLAGEKLAGVVLCVTDAKAHSDRAHSGPRQVVPMASRAMAAAVLAATPRVMQPVLGATIVCPDMHLGAVYNTLAMFGGHIVSDEMPPNGSPVHDVTAHMPVRLSFGFAAALRGATSGACAPQMWFDHWALYQGVLGADHNDTTNELVKLLHEIRTRKKMQLRVPAVEDLTDRL
eukprot:GFYU01002813.1.p1 GENE.GFYU01002813.1~~GFYU01002813.1.p1  ORF type:complete len:1052 (-),score=422.98 GFYU01002813.1:569-3724(-)